MGGNLQQEQDKRAQKKKDQQNLDLWLKWLQVRCAFLMLQLMSRCYKLTTPFTSIQRLPSFPVPTFTLTTQGKWQEETAKTFTPT